MHLSERMQGPFQRSIPMPAPVIADSVSAELKNGVLQVRLMKSEKGPGDENSGARRAGPGSDRPHRRFPRSPPL